MQGHGRAILLCNLNAARSGFYHVIPAAGDKRADTVRRFLSLFVMLRSSSASDKNRSERALNKRVVQEDVWSSVSQRVKQAAFQMLFLSCAKMGVFWVFLFQYV